MKILKGLIAAAVCGAMALALISCGDYVGKEKSHPLFVKGGTCKSSGNYKDAAKYFEDFLLICPKSAKTHYELATLYGDNLDEPIKAIYHYQAYLDMSPSDAADAASVKQFIDMTKRKAMEKLNEEFKNTPESEKSAKELADAKEKLAKYVEYAKAIKTQNDMMRQRLLGSKAKPGKNVEPAIAGPTAATSNASNAAKTASKPEVYKTKAGDTIESVAKKVYGSAGHAKFLRDANKGVVPANGKFKAGVTLKVPSLPSNAEKSAEKGAPAPKAEESGAAAPAPVQQNPAQDEASKLGVGVQD